MMAPAQPAPGACVVLTIEFVYSADATYEAILRTSVLVLYSRQTPLLVRPPRRKPLAKPHSSVRARRLAVQYADSTAHFV
jgi:hypothetical protein